MNNSKLKLDMMKRRGIQWVLIDSLALYDKIRGIEVPVEVYSRVVQELKVQYTKEIKTDDVVSKQRDLENLIQSISDGGDKFVNKMMKDANTGTE